MFSTICIVTTYYHPPSPLPLTFSLSALLWRNKTIRTIEMEPWTLHTPYLKVMLCLKKGDNNESVLLRPDNWLFPYHTLLRENGWKVLISKNNRGDGKLKC